MELLQEIGTKIGFDWRLAVTHFINLLIIFFLLAKFALPGIKKVVADRTRKIEEGLKMRNDADKILLTAQDESKKVSQLANQKAQEIISKGESNAKNIISEANQKASEVFSLAEKEKQISKEKGLKEAEDILSRDIAKILSKISTNAFSSKVTAQVNNEFISNVFKSN